MTRLNIRRQRLENQQMAHPTFQDPADAVKCFGAVQAQDFLGALWAVGLRTRGATESTVEQALAEGRMVRTWPLRGTLHFVAAGDVRWMLKLLTPRVIAGSAFRYRQLELDEAEFARSRKAAVRALEGHKALTRDEFYKALESAHISTVGQRGFHILGRLAQEGLICFGGRAGKQHTIVLLDEWVPPSAPLERDAAMGELARRYFTSHGPATVQDFAWWSGLSTAEAREGLALAQSHLLEEKIGGQTYWFAPSTPGATSRSAFLLPAFDEYTVAYRDRSALADPLYVARINPRGGMLSPVIVIGGAVVGLWKRTLQKSSVLITPTWFTPPGKAEQRALAAAARAYGAFLGLSPVVA